MMRIVAILSSSLVLAYLVPAWLSAQSPAISHDAERIYFQAGDVSPEELSWRSRAIVLFAENENDPRLLEQLELLSTRPEELAARDVVVVVDAMPCPVSKWRRLLRPRGFALVLIGKDGEVVLRKPFPWDVREISRSIDKMPIRQQELRALRSAEEENS